MKKEDYSLFSRPNGKIDRKNKFSFELLIDKEFRKRMRCMWRDTFGRASLLYKTFQRMSWTDDHLLENINKCLYIYKNDPGEAGFCIYINGLSNFRMSSTDEVDGKGKPKKYTMIAYTKEGHRECRKSASKLFIEAYKEQTQHIGISIPDKVLNRCAELFAIQWEAYAKSASYELHIDTNFEGIYEAEGFGSCMTGKGLWCMYRDYTKGECRAAYLTNIDGDIVARAILWTNAKDDNGNTYRLLDRCYSIDGDVSLQQVLIDACIAEGQIDLYKPAGCSCHDQSNIKTLDGGSFKNTLRVALTVESGDPVSYMDTFKWYDLDGYIAYNEETDSFTHKLDITDGELQPDGIWSDYYQEYIEEDVAIWSDDVESYIDCNDRDFFCEDGEYYMKEGAICTADTGNYFHSTEDLYYCDSEDAWYEYDNNLVWLEYREEVWRTDKCQYSYIRDCYIAEEDAIYVDNLNDWDFLENADEYKCTTDANGCYIYNSIED